MKTLIFGRLFREKSCDAVPEGKAFEPLEDAEDQDQLDSSGTDQAMLLGPEERRGARCTSCEQDQGSAHRQSTFGVTSFAILSAILVVVTAFVTWRVTAPAPTNFHEETSTVEDALPYPIGQVTWSHQIRPLPCGQTPQEALARGCHFDFVSCSWLPVECIDYELVEEFKAAYPWQFYLKHNDTFEEINGDDDDFYGMQTEKMWTANRWHGIHCLYIWKKMHRAVALGKPIDGQSFSRAHIDHCIKIIGFNPRGLQHVDDIESFMPVLYLPC